MHHAHVGAQFDWCFFFCAPCTPQECKKFLASGEPLKQPATDEEWVEACKGRFGNNIFELFDALLEEPDPCK